MANRGTVLKLGLDPWSQAPVITGSNDFLKLVLMVISSDPKASLAKSELGNL